MVQILQYVLYKRIFVYLDISFNNQLNQIWINWIAWSVSIINMRIILWTLTCFTLIRFIQIQNIMDVIIRKSMITKFLISQKKKKHLVEILGNTNFWLRLEILGISRSFLRRLSIKSSLNSAGKSKINLILFVLFLVVDYKLVRILDSCCILVLNYILEEDCIQEEDCIRVKDWNQETDCIQVWIPWWVSRFLLVQGIPDAGTKYFVKGTKSLSQTKIF